MLIEYRIAYSNEWVDFIISGLNTDNNHYSLIIEMKGWEKIDRKEYELVLEKVEFDDRWEKREHPSFQVNTYKEHLINWYQNNLIQNFSLDSCVLMHEIGESEGKKEVRRYRF